ncbi:MAG TPA: twin-arginine translocase subunit TatC [Solirubrobacteraceae bacterium]|nr:twin-arginine translocase subunit TatC [Solirubrobacteraceae bacterium]
MRPIGHEDKLTLVDHLTELRKRLLISAATLVVAFGFCFWQNHAILDIVTKPVTGAQNYSHPSKSSKDPLEKAALFQKEEGQALRALAPALTGAASTFKTLASAANVTEPQRSAITASATKLVAASRQVAQAASASSGSTQRNLVTLGVTEPFTATITIAFYASLLLAMPMLLFQAYAFVLPAFSPGERKIALPLMLMVPVLFIAGAAFGYFVVLDRALKFLLNFNDDSFDILLQAKDYFKFAVIFIAGVGLLFQIPVGVLAITRIGIFTPKQLAKNRGYVILGISILAAVATPTPDPFTMSLAMAPLIVLFELSILLARWIGRVKPVSDRSARWDDADDIDYDDVEAAPVLDEEDDLPPGDDDDLPPVDVDGAVPIGKLHDDVENGDEDGDEDDDEDDDDGEDPSKLGDPDRKD